MGTKEGHISVGRTQERLRARADHRTFLFRIREKEQEVPDGFINNKSTTPSIQQAFVGYSSEYLRHHAGCWTYKGKTPHNPDPRSSHLPQYSGTGYRAAQIPHIDSTTLQPTRGETGRTWTKAGWDVQDIMRLDYVAVSSSLVIQV